MASPAPVVILLPPSEGKAPGGEVGEPGPFRLSFPTLDRHRAVVARTLVAALGSRAVDNADLLGVRGPALLAGTAAGLSVATSPRRPAIERYTGVLYDALGYSQLSAAAQERSDRSVVIVSGLHGLVIPRDPIPDYKLPIGAALPRLGRLASWWRPRLSPALNRHVTGAVVWDLLPGAHAAAWADGGRAQCRWRVRVVREDPETGVRSTVSHENKTGKGALARFLVAEADRGVDPRELLGVEFPGGYRVDVTTPAWGERGGVVDVVARAGSR